MTERRFTDRDVALILRRAAELDRRAPSETPVRGLSEVDLKGIAEEVGIDPGMISRAVAELDRPRGLGSSGLKPLGPGLVQREIRAVPQPLPREALAELVRVVDSEVPAQGTLGEALGTVRWNGGGRFLSHQVSLEPGRDETLIRIEERFTDRLRAILHGLPAGYGAMAGLVIGMEVVATPLAAVVATVGLAGVGWGIGDAIWRIVSARSRSRVNRLAERLTDAAQRALRPETTDADRSSPAIAPSPDRPPEP